MPGPTPTRGPGWQALWSAHAWRPRPSWLGWLLWPVSRLYRVLFALARLRAGRPRRAARPVIVVGNIVVGGAGKTPVVIALVQALQAAGRRPGVISRGHGRRDGDGGGPRAVDAGATGAAAAFGDEPVLIARRTGVPVWVGRDRPAAAAALVGAHGDVDVIVADDGLQHHALARDAEVIVFDERGTGNGLLLPAGPLREATGDAHRDALVVYNAAQPSTPLPGVLAARTADAALPLHAWRRGDAGARQPLAALRGHRLVAVAGIGAPEKFFAMLRAHGLQIEPCPQADHATYDAPPWPAGTREVITTEKDAVKFDPAWAADDSGTAPADAPAVWVVPLDLTLPDAAVREVLARIGPPGAPR